MSNHTPSRYRRLGRDAFDPNADPQEVCPYKVGAYYNSASHRVWWLDGWDEARVEYEESRPECYACEKRVNWLAPDGRCGECTNYTPEEIRGDEQ